MKRTYLYTTLIISILMLAGSLFGLYLLRNEILSNITESEKLRAKIYEEKEREVRLKILEDSIKESEADRQKIKTYFIYEDDISVLFDLLESSAKTAGVNLNIGSINPTPVTIENINNLKVSTISANLTFSGTWNRVMNYVVALENLPYKVKISRLDMTKTNDGPLKKSLESNWQAGLVLEMPLINTISK